MPWLIPPLPGLLSKCAAGRLCRGKCPVAPLISRSGNQLIGYAPCLLLRDSWHLGHLPEPAAREVSKTMPAAARCKAPDRPGVHIFWRP